MGKLSLCGTPIGNLDDLTYRVVKTLESCDVVYAEDTRRTLKLLNVLNLSKPLYSYHEHNKNQVTETLIHKIRSGDHVVLVTDAGMPGISDPGEDLVKVCIEEGVAFEVIPGVTAFTTALVGSGLCTKRFTFEGFLSRQKKERKLHLGSLINDPRTLIFYESPHRLKQTLKDLYSMFGDRKVVVARELTKRYETFIRGLLSELIQDLEGQEIKGEIVLIVEGAEEPKEEIQDVMSSEAYYDQVKLAIEEGYVKKEAIKKIAKDFNVKKKTVYDAVLEFESKKEF